MRASAALGTGRIEVTNIDDALLGPGVTELGSQRVAGVGRVCHQSPVLQRAGDLADETRLRVLRVDVEEASHTSLYDDAGRARGAASSRGTSGTRPLPWAHDAFTDGHGNRAAGISHFITPLQSFSAGHGHRADPIVTQVTPAQSFTPAEEYHQRYLEKRARGDCRRYTWDDLVRDPRGARSAACASRP